jgi:RimJ/RimL family protein N-acetyltransferase
MAHIDSEICRLKDGAEVTLRTGVPEDTSALLATISSYITENEGMSWGPGEFRKTDIEMLEWIRRMLAHPSEILIIAEVDGEIVGNIDLHVGTRRRMAHVGEFGMGMLPKVRGRGLGSLLLDRMIQWARQVPELEKINLRVLSTNRRAIELYRKFGFFEEGRRLREIRYSDGSYADDVLMGMFVLAK